MLSWRSGIEYNFNTGMTSVVVMKNLSVCSSDTVFSSKKLM